MPRFDEFVNQARETYYEAEGRGEYVNKIVAGTILEAAETIQNDPRNVSDEDRFVDLYSKVQDDKRFSGHQKFANRVSSFTDELYFYVSESEPE